MAYVIHLERARAESFGSGAEAYDRTRPRYPDALLDDLAGGRALRVLDVGCGTGIVAEALRAKGCQVLGVEPDARMAAVARRKGIAVETAPFETWAADGRRFDLVTCGQAWHWVDPVSGPAKAASVLRPGGRLALFWNVNRFDDATRAALDEVYAEHAPDLRDSLALGRASGDRALATVGAGDALGLLRAGSFRAPEVRTYTWHAAYSTAGWVGQIGTYSDHRMLPAPARDALLEGVARVIDRLGGHVVATYHTVAVVATRR